MIGDALIDEIRDGGGVVELVGGAALNVAVGVRRLGVDVTLIAMVGDDAAGDHIREYLADYGVGLVTSPSPLGSSRAVVVRDAHGEPTYTFNEAARGRSIRYGEAARQAIAQADLVVVSCFPFDVPAEVDALAQAVTGARLAIDPNPRAGMMRDREEFVRGFERMVPDAVAVKVGADDAALLYDGDLLELGAQMRMQGAQAVMMTAGSEGASIITPYGEVSRPISQLPGPVVDTVGAGDATLAALVAGLVQGEPADQHAWGVLLQRAMDVAAATVRGPGGLLRTPESLAESAGRGPGGS